jgi:hypothetical protein
MTTERQYMLQNIVLFIKTYLGISMFIKPSIES